MFRGLLVNDIDDRGIIGVIGYAKSGPQMCNESTIGKSSKKVVFEEVHEAGHAPQNHSWPKIAP